MKHMNHDICIRVVLDIEACEPELFLQISDFGLDVWIERFLPHRNSGSRKHEWQNRELGDGRSILCVEDRRIALELRTTRVRDKSESVFKG